MLAAQILCRSSLAHKCGQVIAYANSKWSPSMAGISQCSKRISTYQIILPSHSEPPAAYIQTYQHRKLSITLSHNQYRRKSDTLHTAKSTSSSTSTLRSKFPTNIPVTPQQQPFIHRILPSSAVPYAELSRWSSPAGWSYLFMPCLFSTLLAASTTFTLSVPPPSPASVLWTTTLFLAGAITMRGAGCTVNDLWDRNYDRKVTRTKGRPLARGATTPFKAFIWFCAQSLTGLAILVQFPTQCIMFGIPSMLLVSTYPLAKRVTNYPQLVLGLTFSWGAVLGFPATGVDLLTTPSAAFAAASLYASCVIWTLVYDTVYAFQDIKDDKKVGIKSSALAQVERPKRFLAVLAAAQVGLLAGAGYSSGLGPVFYGLSCGGAAGSLGWMISKVKLGDVKSCAWWFGKGCWITGGVVSLGLSGEYLTRLLEVVG